MNQQHHVEEWRASRSRSAVTRSAVAGSARSHFKFETTLLIHGYSFGGGKANEA